MGKRISPLKSGAVLLAIYVVISMAAGFVGEKLLKISNYEVLVEIIVSLALTHILFHVYKVDLFGLKNIRWGLECMLVGVVIVLLLNNDFSNLAKNLSTLGSVMISTFGTAIFEETVFRVIAIFLIANIFYNSRYKLFWELYLSSGIFGLAHLYNIYSAHQAGIQTMIQVLYAICLGTIFAWSYLLTKNIFYALILHFAANTFSILLTGTNITNVALTTINFIELALMILITVGFNWYLIRRQQIDVLVN